MTEKNQDIPSDFDFAAEKKALVKELFWIYQDGKLEQYIRSMTLRLTKLAVKKGEVSLEMFLM